MPKRKVSNEESALESLRLDYTDLNQIDFALKCGVSPATYQRWISSDKEPRLIPSQVVNVCRICKISLWKFYEVIGIDISDIPKK